MNKEKILKSLKKNNAFKIVRFSSKDEDEFYEFLSLTLDLNNYAFENNWLYVIQATRNGRFKFYHKDSVVYFTFRYNDLYRPNYIVIVNAIGKNPKEATLKLCGFLHNQAIDILIKNIDKKEVSFWKKHGFVESINPWSKYSFRDDNSFPLHIISSEILKAKKFNRDYRRLFRKFDKENIFTEPYNSIYDLKAKNLLVNNGSFLFNKGVEEKVEVIRAHLFFFDDSIKNQVRVQHLRNWEFIGFSSLVIVGHVAFGNVLVCKKEENLMKYLFFSCMNYICDKYPHVKYFSIQGSENRGQDFFKRRFNPCKSIEKTHLIYDLPQRNL